MRVRVILGFFKNVFNGKLTVHISRLMLQAIVIGENEMAGQNVVNNNDLTEI